MAQTSAKAAKPNILKRLSRYYNDVRVEMKRVVWPSRKEIINSSGIVLATLAIFIVLIFTLDYVSAALVAFLAKAGG
jgi:preprotein translocase subunit SecE